MSSRRAPGSAAAGRSLQAVLQACVILLPGLCAAQQAAGPPARTRTALAYLAESQDRFHRTFYVYDDFISAGNHFEERARMCNKGDEKSVPPMDEAWTHRPHGGINCIRCSLLPRKSNWGGWMFLAGVYSADTNGPHYNWGDRPDSGYDLRGATQLTFWARGEHGGERIQFFCAGIGRNPSTGRPTQPYPDSAPQTGTKIIELTADWQKYAIDLSKADLGRVLLGFGWVAKSSLNGHAETVFYLDDIEYDQPRLGEPRFLLSYECAASSNRFDLVMRNTAFVYDNAVALLAFLAAGDTARARLIADALVYAQAHDRFYQDGRLRNGYQAGDLRLPPGWAPNGRARAARLPGWWDPDQQKWLEDGMCAGTYAGNVAWAMLALLAFHEATGEAAYLAAAARMGDWVHAHCLDLRGTGGYTGGYEGWEPAPAKLTFKSTEHNLDLYVAFKRLALATGQPAWRDRALWARRFVQSMWDPREGKFWTGTGADGETVFREVVPLDVQPWSILALREEAPLCLKALDYAEAQLSVGRGFDFNQDTDGVWHEGTAHMAAAYGFTRQGFKRDQLLGLLHAAQDAGGGLAAADRDSISTGFNLADNQPWLYFPRIHAGATGWLVLAEYSKNPFWMGTRFRSWGAPDANVAVKIPAPPPRVAVR